MEQTEKKSSEPDTTYVYLSTAQSAVWRAPTSGEAANENAAKEAVVASKSQRPKIQRSVVIKEEDAEDEYR